MKTAVFCLVAALVLYPKVWLLPIWISRLRNLEVTLDPNHPGLARLEAELSASMDSDAPLPDLARPLEQLICERIPYAFDWETWGVMDYVPTVAEVMAKGREDCDGRAVVAASLLRRLGYEAWLTSDLKHVWVVARDTRAPAGAEIELMSPGRGQRTLTGDRIGTRVRIGPATVRNLAHGLAFGVGVFPLGREFIILAALCAVTMHPWSSTIRRIAGCLLLAAALGLVRAAGPAADRLADRPILLWSGLAVAVLGWLILLVKARGAGRGAVQGGGQAVHRETKR